MRGLLDLPHGLHEGVLDDDTDIAAGVTIRQLGELAVVLGLEGGRGLADGDLEHSGAGGEVGQADVNAALETAAVEETALETATLEAAELEIADTVVAEAADDVPSAAGAGAAALYVARRTEQIIALVKLSILYLASGRWTG